MSANAVSVGFQLACNVHVWPYFENYQFQEKLPMVLSRTFPVSNLL